MEYPPSSRTPGVPKQYPMNPSVAQIRRRRLRLLWSYLPDWILCIGLTGAFYALDYVDGFEREFDLTDTSIQHSFTAHERVPNLYLLIYVVAAPLVILPIINIITIRSWWDWHNSVLGLILSLSLTGAVSQVVKVLVGRPRPDLIARCLPAPGSANGPVFGLVTSAICTQKDVFTMRDGFRSFPSAHSSLSFAGLGFLSFYLAGKLHLFDERGYTGKAWVSLTPFVGAAVIAISRTMDYRHHPTDVMTGSTLGLVFAFFAYRQYYPSLSSTLSHRPYSPRIPSLKVTGPVVDVERGRTSPASDLSTDHETLGAPAPGKDSSRTPYHHASPSTTHLVPPAQPYAQRPSMQQNHGKDSFEMDTTSIDGTVHRPRQDLEQVWQRGGETSGQH
ncbi:hypothetical protein M408DRAFT_327933 [Serendipita vermifera MAFF 305830]|uniref:Phosphatidic acid phosphatase type 2/haloperoxidase domain-containing protein n=1 Tax=Serendipita vermifera MAFF 305830 TaxID=933852 RepID=A0A0C3BFS8_SERVB|nr:hypothetical protein M408DRAFT_327933 [Serendipita vermifera MAFF 305830]